MKNINNHENNFTVSLTRGNEVIKSYNQNNFNNEEKKINSKNELVKIMRYVEDDSSNNIKERLQKNVELKTNPENGLIKIMNCVKDDVTRDMKEEVKRNIELKVNPENGLIKIMDFVKDDVSRNVKEIVEGNVESENRLNNGVNNVKENIESKGINSNSLIINKLEFINIDGFINLVDKKDCNYRYFTICNFDIEAKKIIIQDNGLFIEKYCIFKCILANNNESKIVKIKYNELNSDKWILNVLGVKYCLFPIDKSYEYLKVYIAQKFEHISVEIEYIHVGWRVINNKFVYLHGGGAIGDYNINITGDKGKIINVDNGIRKEKALIDSINMLNISDNILKTLPLLLYSHLGVLREVYVQAGFEPHFTIWVYGLTGSMKTSVSKVFFNIFNRERDYISGTFKDTKTAVEIKASEYKDSILLLDDYHPTTLSAEKKAMESLASHVLRIYGDGISKSRSNKNLGKAQEYPPRGLCVITGEDIIGGESSVARFIGIEVCPGDYKSDVLMYYQNNPLIYSTHIYYFIECISQYFNEIVSFIKLKFNSYRNEVLNEFRHKRLSDSYAFLCLTYDILLQYCKSLIGKDINNIFYNKNFIKNIIKEVIRVHEQSTTNQDPAILYLMAIQELILSKKYKVLDKNENKNENGNIIGYKDDEYYYLIPGLAYNSVIEFWKRQNIEFPVSSDRVNKALDELKIIKTSLEGNTIKRTIKVTINGERKRYLTIHRNSMENILNNI